MANANLNLPNSSKLFALTCLQEKIYCYSAACDSASYNMPRAYLLKGNIKPNDLESALSSVIKENTILHCRVDIFNGSPFFKALDSFNYVLNYVDFSSHANPLKEAMALYAEEEEVPINVNLWPLFRVSLLKLSAESFILLLNFHHIIFDMNSWSLFFDSLQHHYNSISTKDVFGSQDITKKSFEDINNINKTNNHTSHILPTAIQESTWKHLKNKRDWSWDGEEYNAKVEGDFVLRYKNALKKLRVFPSTIFLWAYSKSIFKFINEDHTYINILMPDFISNVNKIGCFLKSVDIKIESSKTNNLSLDIRQLQGQFMEAYQKNLQIPYYNLNKEEVRKAPFPQFNFDFYQETASDNKHFANMPVERLYTDTKTAKQSLSLSVRPFLKEECFKFRLEYSTSELNRSIIEQFYKYFLSYCNKIINFPV